MDELELIENEVSEKEFVIFIEGERIGSLWAENEFHAIDLAISEFDISVSNIPKLEAEIFE